MTRALAAGLFAIACLAAGCDSGDKKSSSGTAAEKTDTTAKETSVPAGVAEPRTVEDSGKVGARAVEKVYGKDVAPGQPTVIGSSCDNGSCVIRYRSEARGEGKVVAEQDRILRPVFAQHGVRSVTLYVHQWSTGTPEKNEAPVFATTTCRQSEHPSFDFAHIGAADITRVCKFVHEAGGQLRSEVRKGSSATTRRVRGTVAAARAKGKAKGKGKGRARATRPTCRAAPPAGSARACLPPRRPRRSPSGGRGDV